MTKATLWIGGQPCPAESGQTFQRYSPWNGEPVTEAAAAGIADAEKAIQAAATAFPQWSALAPTVRRQRLIEAADLLQAHTAQIVELAVAETGGTTDWVGFNVMLAANVLREAAALTTQISGEVVASDMAGGLALTLREPYGVVLGVAPWNSPVVLAVRAIAMPLACGNTVILKGSEQCPATHAYIGELLSQSSLGGGVVNVITTAATDAADVVAHVIQSPLVRHINFTGSTRVGKIVAGLAAQSLTPSLLELGGKNSLIVLDDADVDAAVSAIAFGAFMNQGQICISTERVIVDESIADELVTKLKAKVSQLKAGENAPLGVLVSPDSAHRVELLIQQARARGAQLVSGGEVTGACMQPTILDRVNQSMNLYREESFGPVVSIIRVCSQDESVEVANDTEYGLSAAVYSQSFERALSVARQLVCGNCHINGSTLYDEPQMAMGGTRASGWGRFGGKGAIDEFTQLKSLTIQSGKQFYPF